jgi:hypothetical protein
MSARSIRQLARLTVEVGQLEILAEVRTSDVRRVEARRVGRPVTAGQRSNRKYSQKQEPALRRQTADSQIGTRQ